jgi:enoyl-CoA hydratase
VPADRLLEETLAAAEVICQLGLPSVMAAKACVNQAFEGPLTAGMLHERQVFHSLFATADQKEGMDAFLAKRKPVFTHR